MACDHGLSGAVTCVANKQVYYDDWRLGLLRQVLRMAMPTFLLYSFIRLKTQKRFIATEHYFAARDDSSAGSARFDTPASLTEESIKVIFIPTLTTSYYQLYRTCGQDELNPGIRCTGNDDCIRYYGQANATCNATSSTCHHSPVAAWCTVNATRTSLFDYREHLLVTTLARATCKGRVFSNYPTSGSPDHAYYTSSLPDILQAAFRGQRLSTKVAESSARNFSELFRVGADLQITYDWRCDLDLNPGRYDCHIKRVVEVMDNIATRTTSTPLVSASSGHAARLLQEDVGFRLRFKGSGGCYESTLASILSLVSKGFALESLCAIVMTGVVLLWHAWHRVERAERVFVHARKSGEVRLISTGMLPDDGEPITANANDCGADVPTGHG